MFNILFGIINILDKKLSYFYDPVIKLFSG
ncbi:Uncharacterised protein [Yersinia mollaretii]|nr:Uncharacterised protein [Yersinia mollaretii]CNJ88755.1 Uncharacterised protein [Yersinia mollaretii]CQJ08045.1 Uncharacterised protein [Yersinia mollaretii]